MTTQNKVFNENLETLKGLGFNLNDSLNIIKRVNQHIDRCVENNQNYDETLFYVKQDFTFDNNTMQNILINAIIANSEYEQYFK